MRLKSIAELYAQGETKGVNKQQVDNAISWLLKQGIAYEIFDGWYVRYDK